MTEARRVKEGQRLAESIIKEVKELPRLKLHDGFINPVYLPYISDTTRVQIFFDGSSSGKSVFLATRCVLDALQGRRYAP